MPNVEGIFVVGSPAVPVNGATVQLYTSSAAFAQNPPVKDTPFPVSPVAVTTTGAQHGGDGHYRFTGLAGGEYYVGVSYMGHVVWDYFDLVASASQITAGQFETARLRRGATIILCQAFTPAGTGLDPGEMLVPYDPVDGVTSITWNVRRIWLRVRVAGGAPVAVIQKSTAGNAAFGAGTTVGTLTMVSGEYLAVVTSALGTVASGDILRFNVTALGTATEWVIGMLLGN